MNGSTGRRRSWSDKGSQSRKLLFSLSFRTPRANIYLWRSGAIDDVLLSRGGDSLNDRRNPLRRLEISYLGLAAPMAGPARGCRGVSRILWPVPTWRRGVSLGLGRACRDRFVDRESEQATRGDVPGWTCLEAPDSRSVMLKSIREGDSTSDERKTQILGGPSGSGHGVRGGPGRRGMWRRHFSADQQGSGAARNRAGAYSVKDVCYDEAPQGHVTGWGFGPPGAEGAETEREGCIQPLRSSPLVVRPSSIALCKRVIR